MPVLRINLAFPFPDTESSSRDAEQMSACENKERGIKYSFSLFCLELLIHMIKMKQVMTNSKSNQKQIFSFALEIRLFKFFSNELNFIFYFFLAC